VTLPIAQFLTVWAFLAVNIASPGPNVINTIATAMGSGRRAGLGSAVGVGIGIGVWCLSMSLGLASVFAVWPFAQVLMTVVAIGLLIWFSSRYLRSAWAGFHGRHAPRVDTAGKDSMGFGAGMRRSLLINAMNPKALTSWIAILSLFPVARAEAGDIGLLTIGACCLSFGIHSIYVLAFSSAPAARLYLRHGWVVTGTAGIFFATVAAKLGMGLMAGN
jgi:threonine efflux protein